MPDKAILPDLAVIVQTPASSLTGLTKYVSNNRIIAPVCSLFLTVGRLHTAIDHLQVSNACALADTQQLIFICCGTCANRHGGFSEQSDNSERPLVGRSAQKEAYSTDNKTVTSLHSSSNVSSFKT